MSKKKNKPKVHPELDGLEVNVNSFGEIQTNLPIEKINEFLDKNIQNKKINKSKNKDK